MDKELLIKKLRDSGQRLTAIKSQILDIFLEERDYLDAGGVHERLTLSSDLSTIYRNLDALYHAGILDIVYKDDKRWFKMVEEEEHRHFVICEKCGEQKLLDFCPFKHINSQIEGYDIRAHTFELIGVCPSCAAAESDRFRGPVCDEESEQDHCGAEPLKESQALAEDREGEEKA